MKRCKLGMEPPSGRQVHMTKSAPGAPTVAEIQRTVARHFDIAPESMKAKARETSRPRQVAMFFAREVALKSYPRIASLFGGLDHTTIIHGVRTVERLMAENHDFKDEVEALREEIFSCPL
jgi:chromosomal replication initiator protein